MGSNGDMIAPSQMTINERCANDGEPTLHIN